MVTEGDEAEVELDEGLGLSGVNRFSDEDRGGLTLEAGGVSFACLAEGGVSFSSDLARFGLWLLLAPWEGPIMLDSILWHAWVSMAKGLTFESDSWKKRNLLVGYIKE